MRNGNVSKVGSISRKLKIIVGVKWVLLFEAFYIKELWLNRTDKVRNQRKTSLVQLERILRCKSKELIQTSSFSNGMQQLRRKLPQSVFHRRSLVNTHPLNSITLKPPKHFTASHFSYLSDNLRFFGGTFVSSPWSNCMFGFNRTLWGKTIVLSHFRSEPIRQKCKENQWKVVSIDNCLKQMNYLLLLMYVFLPESVTSNHTNFIVIKLQIQNIWRFLKRFRHFYR